jgi:3-deoxy-D-manno-octulosonic-acid transferase
MTPASEQRRYALAAYRSLPITFVRRVVFGGDPYWRQYFWSRWGFVAGATRSAARGRPIVLIDAISGGEVTQAVTFCRKLRFALPDHALVLSTANRYSYEFAVKNLAVDAVIESPWDCRRPIRRFLSTLAPVAVVGVENLSAPVLFRESARRGIPTVLVSGLMSANFDRHPMIQRALESRAFAEVDRIGAKSDEDVRGFITQGAAPERVTVTGNMKFDLEYLHVSDAERAGLREALQLHADEPVLLAASVHPGEEELVGEAYVDARRTVSGLRLVLVPRYAAHAPAMIEKLRGYGLTCVLRTTLGRTRARADDVIVVDTFGELNRLYALSSVVFLGGTTYLRNAVGAGQNPIEPLAQRRPLFFGQYMGLWRHVTEPLKAAWPGVEVVTAKELAAGVVAVSEDLALAARLEARVDEILASHRDDITRNVELVTAAVTTGRRRDARR